MRWLSILFPSYFIILDYISQIFKDILPWLSFMVDLEQPLAVELSTGPGMHKIRVQPIAEVLMTNEPVFSMVFFCDNSPYWSLEQEGEQWDPNLK